MASFNLRTYEADWGAQFSVENAQASLTYFLEADDDDPIPPTVAEVIAKIKELTGWTDTAVSPNGGLVRYLPQAHPIFQNLVAANVHVEPVRDEPKFTVLAPDPTEAREAEPVGPALAWGSWKFDVTFMPRPYPMISDARMEHTTDDWVDEDNNLQPIQYLPEWYRFCVFQTAPREEFVRGKLGDNARFVTGSGDRPNNVPYPAITTLPLPDDVLTVAFHNVPARWIESPNSYLRRFRNKINQKPWMGYEAAACSTRASRRRATATPSPGSIPTGAARASSRRSG